MWWSYKIRPWVLTQPITVLLRSIEQIVQHSALPTSLHVILVEIGSRRMAVQMLALRWKCFNVNYKEQRGGGRFHVLTSVPMLPSVVWYSPLFRINMLPPSSAQKFHTFRRNILPPELRYTLTWIQNVTPEKTSNFQRSEDFQQIVKRTNVKDANTGNNAVLWIVAQFPAKPPPSTIAVAFCSFKCLTRIHGKWAAAEMYRHIATPVCLSHRE